MKNKVQLITYVDRFGGGGIEGLHRLLNELFQGVFDGVHILPFFYPSDKSDTGFDPINHLMVDPGLGDWKDIKKLSSDMNLMADMIVNHISTDSLEFQDFLEKGDESDYAEMFLSLNKVFPNGVSEEKLMKIYLPRPDIPFTVKVLKDGTRRVVWTTFTSDQVDIDVVSKRGQEYLDSILQTFHENGIKMVRLDAAGYAMKKQGTSCFMIPETFDLLHDLSTKANDLNMEVLVEVHTYYKTQIQISKKVNYIYDFALSVLILHSIYTRNSEYIKGWLKISPRNTVTVLDTHDGISIVSISPNPYDPESRGLLPLEEIKLLVESIHDKSNGASRKASGTSARNMDIHQVNCTFYEALGCNDKDYLLARAIQFFSPGIPQVYYVGFLAGKNDMDLLAKTGSGRDINRHFYTQKEIEEETQRSVVKDLLKLIKFRNTHPAFDGYFNISEAPDHLLDIIWRNDKDWVKLYVDFDLDFFSITYSESENFYDLQFESLRKTDSSLEEKIVKNTVNGAA